MAFVAFPSQFPMILPGFVMPPAFNVSVGLLDATGEKFAWQGVPHQQDIGKSLVGVGFRFATIVKASGSGLIVSHQDINLTTGPPEQPDEVMDGQVAIANGDAAFATSTWMQTGAFDVARTITGDPFAIVLEYDGAGRLGTDSVIVTGLNGINANAKNAVGSPALKTAAWAAADSYQNILFEFGDGTFGTFIDAYPSTTLNVIVYNNSSGVDERALEFTVPASIKVSGAWVVGLLASGANADIVLYDGTSVMTSVSIDSNTVGSNTNPRPIRVPFVTEQQFDPGHTYRVSLLPTTANNVTLYDFTVNAAAHLQAWPGGVDYYLSTRVDAGSWTPAVTRRPLIGLYGSGIPDGLGGAGGISRARGSF